MNISSRKNNKVDIKGIYSGSIYIHDSLPCQELLMNWCIECIYETFGKGFTLEKVNTINIDEFVQKATATKSLFTNHKKTKALLSEVIHERYSNYTDHELYYDVPRVRIIPNSNFLKSGISYNYQPHRDTWYGGSQDQINHWIAVANVSACSTFFIAPSLFNEIIPNSSHEFDLDEWDKKYRNAARLSIKSEMRPHPVPLIEIPLDKKLGFDLEKGREVCFSGHHLHGSLENSTEMIRISIDYRVSLPNINLKPPSNIDDKSKGDYKKYMIKHNLFANKSQI
jgi:hypothetical protein